MATPNPLEDILNSEVDESAIKSLVGSLESKLLSPTTRDTSGHNTLAPENTNHVGEAHITSAGPVTVAHRVDQHDIHSGNPCNARFPVPGLQSLPSTNGSKETVAQSQIIGVNSTVGPVVVTRTLTNAFPHTTQQAIDIKPPNILLKSEPNVAVPKPTVLVSVGSTNSGTVSLGNTNTVITNGVTNQSGVPAVRNSPVLSLTNVAAERKPLLVSNLPDKKPIHISNALSPSVFHQTSISGVDIKPSLASVGLTQPRPAIVQTVVKQEALPRNVSSGAVLNVSPATSIKSEVKFVPQPVPVVRQPVQGLTNAILKTSTLTPGSSNVITLSRPMSSSPHVTVLRPPTVSQVATGNVSQSSGQAIQIVTNPPRPTNIVSGAKVLAPAPRPAGVPIKIAPQQGQQNVIPGTNLVLPPGYQLPPHTILVKNEQGQFMLVQQPHSQNVSQSKVQIRPQAITQTAPTTALVQGASQPLTVTQAVQGTTAIQVPGSISVVRPQQVTAPVMTRQQVVVPACSAAVVPPPGSAVVGIPQQPRIAAPAAAGGTPAALSTSTATANSILDSVKKCKNFLSTLLKLASQSNQSPETIKNVKRLIQGLIDSKVEPEEFTAKLQIELKSSPQPYLVPFLKKSLPLLRQSLLLNKMHIEGVRPPSTQTPSLVAPPGGGQVITQTGLLTHQGVSHPRAIPPIMINRMQLAPGQALPPASQTRSLLTQPHPAVARPGGGAATVTAKVLTSAKPGAASSSSQKAASAPSGPKEKRKYDASLKDDDDINDVATMGGVNLNEESRNIMATNSELMTGQMRSCKDQYFLQSQALTARINAIAAKHGLDTVPQDVTNLISHAAQERLRAVIEKLDIIAEHRVELYKVDPKYEITGEVRPQLKFLEELEKLEKKRKEETERENLLRIAKSRTKHEDPEQLKLKEKAKAMQQAEMEELRQREANQTALLAIGPRKKRKLDDSAAGSSGSLSSLVGGSSSTGPRTAVLRPRMKRVNVRDVLFLLEQERETHQSPLLYKAFLK